MRKILFAAVIMSLILAMSGCGGGGSNSPPPVFVTSILSNPAFDGDIKFDSPNLFTVTQGNIPSVFAGIDPVTLSEYRAFLVFPLTGAGGVPGSAFIDSASLDIFIDRVSILPGASSIPIRIELVSFPQPLLVSDFNSIAFAFTAIPIFSTDVLSHVRVDITSLMIEAQNRGLANLQIRILEDFGIVSPGRIEIDDTTVNRAPLLTVTYH